MVVKKFFVGIATLCAVIVLAGAVQGCANAAATTQSVAFPMYEHPAIGTLWSDIRTAGSKVPWIIVDPANGPGTTVDSYYTAALNALPTGQRALGYVYTAYQARSLNTVLADVDNWYTLYPQVSGIFVDLLQNGTSDDLCYVATVYNYIKSKHPNDLVVMNFGANVQAQYEPYGDIFGNSENTYAEYQSWASTADGFENNVAYANRFFHIVHTTSTSDMPAALTRTRTNNAGWVLITNNTIPNPYTSVPSYWSTFLTQVATLPQTAVPNRGLTALPSGCLDFSPSLVASATQGNNEVITTYATNVTNTDGLRTMWGPVKVRFSNLPSGVYVKSFSGTGWACNVTTNECVYSGNLTPSDSTSSLRAVMAAGCSYTSGNFTVTYENFAGNTKTYSAAIKKPGDNMYGPYSFPYINEGGSSSHYIPMPVFAGCTSSSGTTTVSSVASSRIRQSIDQALAADEEAVTTTATTQPNVSSANNSKTVTSQNNTKQEADSLDMVWVISSIIAAGVGTLIIWWFIASRRFKI